MRDFIWKSQITKQKMILLYTFYFTTNQVSMPLSLLLIWLTQTKFENPLLKMFMFAGSICTFVNLIHIPNTTLIFVWKLIKVILRQVHISYIFFLDVPYGTYTYFWCTCNKCFSQQKSFSSALSCLMSNII